MPNHSLTDLTRLATDALLRAGANPAMAASTARALVRAEAQGLVTHGLSRVAQYCTHLRQSRVDGDAEPRVHHERPGAVLVDAADGLAFPACALAVDEAIGAARTCGIALAAVTNSHHAGAIAVHLDAVAAAGMVGLAFSNSPAAMPAWGGKRALFGTNPIAAVFPRRDAPPLVIDLALSEAARGKIVQAAREGRPIPLGWALDSAGQPTTDAQAALAGTLLPTGGVKGAMLALVVELLCVALTGAAFGFEADSFFNETGNRARSGHAFIVIDSAALAGSDVYHERIETLLTAMLADDEVRLPGARRQALARRAEAEGIEIGDALLAQLMSP